jgi:predicted DNA-binding protein (MmcQ/YjbR family)
MAERLFPNSTESCTLFGKGERMALAQNIGDPIDLGDGDIIKPQVLWVSSFNGQWSTAVFHLTQRWFCMNQLTGAAPIFSVKHTKHHNLTFEQRSGILSEAMAHAETLGRMARMMKDQDYTNDEFNELVKLVVPLPKAFNDEGEIHAAAERRMKRNRDTMVEAWRTECTEFGTTWKQEEREFFDGNKWLAYNAVQGAEQHNINSQFNTTEVGTQRAMTKMVNGVTPYAKRALNLLTV